MIAIAICFFALQLLRSATSIATLYRLSLLYLEVAFVLCAWVMEHERPTRPQLAISDLT